jgi:hypothetical protein
MIPIRANPTLMLVEGPVCWPFSSFASDQSQSHFDAGGRACLLAIQFFRQPIRFSLST